MLEHVIYLHGFNSSPKSIKAHQFVAAVAEQYPQITVHVPQLSHWPKQAMADVSQLADNLIGDSSLEKNAAIAFVGSSLGGFYATWLAARFDCKAALINPAVRPDILLADRLGRQQSYHDVNQQYDLTEKHIAQLRQLLVENIPRPENLLVLLQTDDETLDYRQALNHYQDCHLDVAQGGSHGYDDFPDKISQIVSFVS